MKITCRVNIAGTVYAPGTDVSKIASPGELESLRVAGVLTSGKPAKPEKNNPEPAPEPQQASAPPSGTGELVELNVDAKLLDLLRAGGVTSIPDAQVYLRDHSDFTAIKGIGRVGSQSIVDALSALGTQE